MWRVATGLWLISGIVFAQDSGSQSSTDLLNRIENYDSSTCQIIFDDEYTCSGVLINNTRKPGRPLILTAAHCIENEKDLDSVNVVFGKRKLLKDQPFDGLKWSSDSGASLLSMSREIDFALLELKSEIPAHVAPIYLGWSSAAVQPSWVASISSPEFGTTQYSFSLTEPSFATFGGLYNAIDSGHWRVDQWDEGDTAPGSSGAPLLNSDFEILGGMSGSTDWENHRSDYFFKFKLAYNHFEKSAKQLRAWIDPDHLGGMGHFRPADKIKNYGYTSSVTESVKLLDGARVTENFSMGEVARIKGVYITIAGKSKSPVLNDSGLKDSGSTITVELSRNGSEIYTEEVDAGRLLQFSENYVPLLTPPVVSGEFSVSLKFESADSSDYLIIPKINDKDSDSYLIAVNSGKH
jgi:hypothetical protein